MVRIMVASVNGVDGLGEQRRRTARWSNPPIEPYDHYGPGERAKRENRSQDRGEQSPEFQVQESTKRRRQHPDCGGLLTAFGELLQIRSGRPGSCGSRMDRANAIRLMEALMAGGRYSSMPVAKAWVNRKAWEIGLEGQELASALAYAGNEGWLADGAREGQILLTSKGEATMRNLVRRTRQR
jgi:hypothetical protein